MFLKWNVAVFLILESINAFAQPDITWQMCYGTYGSDTYQDVINTSDGGIAATMFFGGYDGDASGLYDLNYPAIILKLDNEMSLQWQSFFGGTISGSSAFQRIFELGDNSFIAGGYTYATDSDFISNHGGSDLMLAKIDENGNKVWSKCYGSSGNEEFENFTPTSDGGFIITGESNSSGGDIPSHYGDSFTEDAVVIKVDNLGNVVWSKVYGGSAEDGAISSILEIEDGIFILQIATYSDDHDLEGNDIPGRKRWLIKIDNEGNIIDENIISGESDLYSYGGHEIIHVDNQILLAGAANPETNLFPEAIGIGGTYDGAIAIFNEELDFIDMKIFGGSNDDVLYRIKHDEEGNYYLLGVSSSEDFDLPANYGGGYDYWIMKTNSNFDVLWSKNFGGSDPCGDLACSSFRGNFVIKDYLLYSFVRNVVPDELPDYDIECGHINLVDQYDTDAWLVVFDLNTEIANTEIKNNNYWVYPNPATDIVYIQLYNFMDDCNILLNLFDITGAKVQSGQLSRYGNISWVDVKDLKSGVYFFELICDGKIAGTEKIVIE